MLRGMGKTERPLEPATSAAPKLRSLRERLGMTQLELAERVGVTRQSLYAIEQGRAEPSVGLAVRIARVLQTSVEELFDDHFPVEEAQAVSGPSKPGDRVMLGWVGEQRVALPLDGRSA